MGHPSFGPMWPGKNPHITTLTRVDGLRLPVHAELKELIRLCIDFTELMGYDVKPGETWGYANRPISGTQTPSNHSQGTSIDINAPANPYASADWHRRNARGTKPFGLQVVCNIPQNVFELWESQGFSLGVRYKNKPDPMHIEFLQPVSVAREMTNRFHAWLAANGNPAPTPNPPALRSNEQIAREVIAGNWGSGETRKQKLTAAGYNYTAVQAEVNRQLKSGGGRPYKKSNTEVAREVIAGKWGNGQDRTNRLRSAGYDAAAVQREVNRLL